MSAERNPLHEQSALSKPLEWITAQTLRAPGAVIGGAILLALLALFITINGLNFKTSRLDLLNPHSQYNQRWLNYLAEFGDRDDVVIVVRGKDESAVTATIDDLAAALEPQSKLFQSILYRRDFSQVKAKGLHFVPVPQLRRIEQSVRQAIEMMPRDGAPTDPGAALRQLNDRLERFDASSPQMQDIVEREYSRIGMLLMASLTPSGPPTAESHSTLRLASASHEPPASFSFEQLSALDPQYLLAEEGQMGFLMLRFGEIESEFARGSKVVGKLRKTIAEVAAKHPQAWIGLTGMPVIEFDEMQASQADNMWTNIISLVAVAVLFASGYGGMRHAMLGVVVLLLGMCYALGFCTLAIGHLNILSAAFGVILIGLGIDYSNHYVATYLKLRSLGYECLPALVQTAADVGPGVVTGGGTTAIAFFMAGLTEFTGLRELGIIAGGGIVLCIMATVLVMPPLMYLADRNRPAPAMTIVPAASWFRLSLTHPRLVMLASLAVTTALMAGMTHLRYDHNLLNLQPRHVESVDIERELFTRMDDSVWFGVSVCETREQLRQRKALFDKLPSVAKTEEIVSLLPESTLPQQRLIGTIYEHLAELPRELPAIAPLDAARLKGEVVRATHLLTGEKPFVTPTSALFGHLSQVLAHVSDAELLARSQMQQQRLAAQVMPQLELLRQVSEPTPPGLADLPRALTDRYVGKNHKHLLKVYAHGDIWDMDRLTQFVAEIESVDPVVTGHPVQTYYASRHMQQSYILSGIYSLIAVFGLLLLDFRSIRYTLLAMVPLLLGFGQMCGIIGWLGIPFNPANTIALPLILGIGVDDGVHMVHDYRRQRGRFQLTDATTVAIILTATTTTASFGSMILCRHQGLQSMGQVLTIGVTCCLLSSVIFFPALLMWLSRFREPAPEALPEAPVLVNAAAAPDVPAASFTPAAAEPVRMLNFAAPQSAWQAAAPVDSHLADSHPLDPLVESAGGLIEPRRRVLPRRAEGEA